MVRPLCTGLDVVVARPPDEWRGRPVALLTNRAATTSDLIEAPRALWDAGIRLEALFAPEHGIEVTLPPGEPVPFTRDPYTGLPVYSLYGADNALSEILPTVAHVLVDLPDVGARFFTYSSTLIRVMQAAARAGVPVTVLDRPNPITGAHVEGPILREDLTSFVGMLPLPVRHGLTLGELAYLAADVLTIQVPLTVVRAEGWRRMHWFDQTGRLWVPPSPNLPHFETALLYPGTCLVEGTNLSEGRGTPYPFHVIGAPWLDGHSLADALNGMGLPGVRFRSVSFRPCDGKHAGTLCHGVHIHITDREQFRPVRTGIAVLVAARAQAPEPFRFLQAPDGSFTFDRLIGTPHVRRHIESGRTWQEITASWKKEERRFAADKRRFHLYE